MGRKRHQPTTLPTCQVSLSLIIYLPILILLQIPIYRFKWCRLAPHDRLLIRKMTGGNRYVCEFTLDFLNKMCQYRNIISKPVFGKKTQRTHSSLSKLFFDYSTNRYLCRETCTKHSYVSLKIYTFCTKFYFF